MFDFRCLANWQDELMTFSMKSSAICKIIFRFCYLYNEHENKGELIWVSTNYILNVLVQLFSGINFFDQILKRPFVEDLWSVLNEIHSWWSNNNNNNKNDSHLILLIRGWASSLLRCCRCCLLFCCWMCALVNSRCCRLILFKAHKHDYSFKVYSFIRL